MNNCFVVLERIKEGSLNVKSIPWSRYVLYYTYAMQI